MAKLWITYREGLRMLGAVRADVPLESSLSRLDIAPWRLFTNEPPDTVAMEQVDRAPEHKRVLLEVTPQDRYDLCGLVIGFFESPFSVKECLRRLSLQRPEGASGSA